MKLLCKKDSQGLKKNVYYDIINYEFDDIVEVKSTTLILTKTVKHKYYLWYYFYTEKELRKLKLDDIESRIK